MHACRLRCAPARVLLVWHSRTGLAQQMADALEAGAAAVAEEMGGRQRLAVSKKRARTVEVGDVLAADGYLSCQPPQTTRF